MRAMTLRSLGPIHPGSTPLAAAELPDPEPGPGEVLVRLAACGVCHTELDEIEGRLPPPRLPVVPGHQAVGRVAALGQGVDAGPEAPDALAPGDRVGIAWIHSACGRCGHCRAGAENLCPAFRGTGLDVDGGYAQYLVAPAAFVHPISDALSDVEAAPMLCAGAIGYRSLALTGLLAAPIAGRGDGRRLGLTGFGGSGHLVLAMVRHLLPGVEVFVFARDPDARRFARARGAVWAGATEARAPAPLDAIIDTTPAWTPVVEALANLAPGGRLVINAIRKEAGDRTALLGLDYAEHLWREKEIKSVANVTRSDVRAFLALAAAHDDLRPEVETYPLADANRALVALRAGRVRGAKVLVIE